MDTKETAKAIFSQNEETIALMKDLGLEPQQKTLLECFEEVVNYSKDGVEGYHNYNCVYAFNEDLLTSKHMELAQIADAYGITERQAALFAIVIEICEGDEVTKRDISERMQANFVTYLTYERDFIELEKKCLLQRCRWGRIRVPVEVMDCLRENKAYHKPLCENMTTLAILNRISKYMKALENEEFDMRMASDEIDYMILSNPQSDIAKTMDKYGILKRDAIRTGTDDEDDDKDFTDSMLRCERMLFYALCYRYHEHDDDDCGWWDVHNFFKEDDMDYLKCNYQNEELGLQCKRVIEYVNIDGMAVKDRFHLTDEVKEQILADAGGLHDRTSLAGLIRSDTIVQKGLFYDESAERQVMALENILSQNRFRSICDSLKEKGLRTGFTCLFYGSPGTGKTETVYQLARRTGRDLITADVTKVKSCWVGESEKNIKNLFSKYKRCVKESKVTPILLFNEADSIFGIRQEGADRAVDKMENSIQNIILQEMETLQGILIATTNLTQNLDKAFERRFLYKVHFENPSIAVKSKIWTSMMPDLTQEQAGELSSRFDFTGGQIENITRKKTVQTILSGVESNFEDLVAFCEDEAIQGPGRRGTKIGF